jgi:hypothetical protein
LLGKGFGFFFPLSVGGFTTFFPDLWKLSLDTLLGKGLKLIGPHSLGTLIEWKLEGFVSPERMADFYKRYPEHFNFILGAILHEN